MKSSHPPARTTMTLRTPLLLAATLALAACEPNLLLDEGEPVFCTAHIQRGIEIRVEDAVTGAPIAAGVRAAAWDMTYADSLRVVGYDAADVASMIGGVPERPGVYRVEIERSGYAGWDSTGVVVGDAVCHVVPARFTVRLQPRP